jgi:tetratricopeptide (TPR) repeat protein
MLARERPELTTGRKLRLSSNLLLAAVLIFIVCQPTFVFAGQQGQKLPANRLSTIPALIASSRLDEAENRLWAILTNEPENTQALNQMARIRILQHREPEAVALYQRVLTLKSDDLAALRGLGEIARGQGKNQKAQEFFERTVAVAPKDTESNRTLTILYAQARQFEKSLAAAAKLPAGERHAELLPYLADDYFSTNQSERAAKLVPAVFKEAGAHPQALYDFVLVMLRHGFVEDASHMLEAAQAKIPSARYLQTLARVRMAQHRTDEARGLLNRALKLDPKSYELLLDSAQLAAQQSRWAEMIQYLRRADDARPDQAEVLQKLSLALLRTGHRSAAVATARRLNALDPENGDNAYVLAYALVEADLEEEAEPIAKKLVSLRPNDANSQLLLGIIGYKVGRMEDARQALAACLTLTPESPDAHYYSALIARHEGNLEAAQSELEALLRKNPSYTMADVELGTIYLQIGNPEQARVVLERAVHDVPDVSQYHYHLSLAYARLKMQDAAKSEMEKYTTLRQREDAEKKQTSAPDAAKAERPIRED